MLAVPMEQIRTWLVAPARVGRSVSLDVGLEGSVRPAPRWSALSQACGRVVRPLWSHRMHASLLDPLTGAVSVRRPDTSGSGL